MITAKIVIKIFPKSPKFSDTIHRGKRKGICSILSFIKHEIIANIMACKKAVIADYSHHVDIMKSGFNFSFIHVGCKVLLRSNLCINCNVSFQIFSYRHKYCALYVNAIYTVYGQVRFRQRRNSQEKVSILPLRQLGGCNFGLNHVIVCEW